MLIGLFILIFILVIAAIILSVVFYMMDNVRKITIRSIFVTVLSLPKKFFLLVVGLLGLLLSILVGILLLPAACFEVFLVMPFWLAVIVELLFVSGIVGVYTEFCSEMVFAIPVIIIILNFFFSSEKLERRKQLREARKQLIDKGIVSLDNLFTNEKSKEKFIKFDDIKIWGDFVVYKPFLKQINEQTSLQGIVTSEELQGYALQAAPGFPTENIKELVEFLQSDDDLLGFSLGSSGTLYVAKPFIQICEVLLSWRGGATAAEFVDECPELKQSEKFSCDSMRLELSRKILQYFVKRNIADSVRSQQGDDTLYVAKKRSPNCIMKTVEISLD